MRRPYRESFIGKRFGRLLVTSDAPSRRKPCGAIVRYVQCLCDCGNANEVAAGHLRQRQITSCGCFQREQASKANTTHGDSRRNGKRTPEYKAWTGLIKRCYTPSDTGFRHWGGRGITVCDRWRYSFPNFLADMGRKPTPKHSVERENNDGNYEPSNCKWATQKEQMLNRRHPRYSESNVKLLQLLKLACDLYEPADLTTMPEPNRQFWLEVRAQLRSPVNAATPRRAA